MGSLRQFGGKWVDSILGSAAFADGLRELAVWVFDPPSWMGAGPPLVIFVFCVSAIVWRKWVSLNTKWRMPLALSLAFSMGGLAISSNFWGLIGDNRIVEIGVWMPEDDAVEYASIKLSELRNGDVSRVVVRQAIWNASEENKIHVEYTCENAESVNDTLVTWRRIHNQTFRNLFNTYGYNGVKSFAQETECVARFWSTGVITAEWIHWERTVPKTPPNLER